jgi:hypothetical protein
MQSDPQDVESVMNEVAKVYDEAAEMYNQTPRGQAKPRRKYNEMNANTRTNLARRARYEQPFSERGARKAVLTRGRKYPSNEAREAAYAEDRAIRKAQGLGRRRGLGSQGRAYTNLGRDRASGAVEITPITDLDMDNRYGAYVRRGTQDEMDEAARDAILGNYIAGQDELARAQVRQRQAAELSNVVMGGTGNTGEGKRRKTDDE